MSSVHAQDIQRQIFDPLSNCPAFHFLQYPAGRQVRLKPGNAHILPEMINQILPEQEIAIVTADGALRLATHSSAPWARRAGADLARVHNTSRSNASMMSILQIPQLPTFTR